MPLDGTNRLALPRVEIRLPVALEDPMIPTLVAALLFAQPSPPAQTPPRTVHASGEGRISVAPDIARVTIGVEAQDQSLARANADATTRMGKAMSTLEKAGVAAKDVRTIRYAVDVQRSFEKSTTGVVIGYRVVNQVLVTIRDLRRLGGLLDQVVAAGANDVEGLSLEKEDISAERGRALERAMSDARGRASVLAKAAGASLGEALQVNEGGPMPIRPIGVMNVRTASVSEVPVSPGELEIFATVDVAFAIR
ncbi:MAG: DUF541 domain-containing protein [Deltaproteobacteria bacterium]|nr:MAG: DUF541 domain-containing protein [Deltaproteobacteria bacterium]